ncbi:hypothetical protein [Microbacterium rhizomatis]|uniref:Uncharacterized protein n=1 Tax=Microbacterium rhizomatis TaxID=1631477 RepID=A0A5J5J5C2_9MICO|nr:hypothetical protein [Microbacterium rhizomatis]KAA9110185.1 hypothetical protein F6B43_00295 [Microbacterium rhizomatis]
MATLKVGGRELVAKPLSKARVSDIIELQRQSGIKEISSIREAVEEADILGNVILSFLTQHNAGFRVKWDDLIDGPLEDLGEYLPDPEPEGEGKEDANPPQAETAADDAADVEASTPE